MTKIAFAANPAETGTAPSVKDVIEALPKWPGV